MSAGCVPRWSPVSRFGISVHLSQWRRPVAFRLVLAAWMLANLQCPRASRR